MWDVYLCTRLCGDNDIEVTWSTGSSNTTEIAPPTCAQDGSLRTAKPARHRVFRRPPPAVAESHSRKAAQVSR